MNIIRRNCEIGSIKLIICGAIALILILILFFSIHWSDRKVLARKHDALVSAIEKRSKSRVAALLSDEYSDRWKFSKEDAAVAVQEVGSQFLALVVNSEDPQFSFENKTATVTTPLKISGKAVGFGSEVIREANKLQTPWIFTWQKEGFGPGGWKIISIENESIPSNAYGYRPGDFQNVLDGNF